MKKNTGIVIGVFAGMIATVIVFSSVITHMNERIEEIRNNQVSNFNKSRVQRERLESKLDSFFIQYKKAL